jgi:hypothetical protein
VCSFGCARGWGGAVVSGTAHPRSVRGEDQPVGVQPGQDTGQISDPGRCPGVDDRTGDRCGDRPRTPDGEGRRRPAAGRAASVVIWCRSAGEKRRCLPRKVQGTRRWAARRRSQDSRTCSSCAAWAGVNNTGGGSTAAGPLAGLSALAWCRPPGWSSSSRSDPGEVSASASGARNRPGMVEAVIVDLGCIGPRWSSETGETASVRRLRSPGVASLGRPGWSVSVTVCLSARRGRRRGRR